MLLPHKVIVLTLCSLASLSHAQHWVPTKPKDAGGYAQISAGPSTVGVNWNGAISSKNSSTGLKVLAGYNYKPQWNAEAMYINWRKAEAVSTTNNTSTTTASGIGAGAAWTPGDEKWGFKAGLGVLRNTAKESSTLSSTTTTTHHVSLGYTLGISFKFNETVSLHVENDGSQMRIANGGTVGLGLTSLGLRVRW